MKNYILIFILIFLNHISFAQNDINIAFGEKINLGNVQNETIFEIMSTKNNYKIIGNDINNFVFEIPDSYNIKVIENEKHNDNDCSHNIIAENIVVKVSSSKIIFDENSISFSEQIHKNKATDGIILTVGVDIISYDQKKVRMNLSAVNVSGIGSAIIAKLDKKFALLPDGRHKISYNLSGIVTENSFLMFDFISPNGSFQSVSLLQPIND